MQAKKSKPALQRWAERQAVRLQLKLYDGDWPAEAAVGRSESAEWEITVSVRSKAVEGLPDAADPSFQFLTPVEIAVMRVVSDREPMSQKQIATASGYESGDYLSKALRSLFRQGLLAQHARGWLKFSPR